MLTLAPLSVLLGIAALWVFRRTSNQAAIRRAKAETQAHLYELRLFVDEPALIGKALWDLLLSTMRRLGLMLVPAAIMAIPMVLLFAQLECFYGHAPLGIGDAAIVTLQFRDGRSGPVPVLQAPDGIAVESPAVRIDGGRQISWRIRALRPVDGVLRFVFPDGALDKTVRAGQGPEYISRRRVSSALDLIRYPAERRLPAGPVDWIEVRYPPATVHAFGLDLDWWIWLLLLSTITALVLKRRFRVAF